MSHILDTNLSSRQLILDSRDATKINGSMMSQATFALAVPITVPEWAQCLVSVQTCVMPVSFYVVNTNNSFKIGASTYTIDHGNPNAKQLVATLNTTVNGTGVTFSYNSVQNKIVISGVGSAGISGPLLGLIGFDPDTTYTGATISSPYVVNLSGINYVFIQSNLTNASNIDSNTGCSQSNVLAAIPIDQPYGSVVTYTGGQHKSLISTHQISEIKIEILDENRSLIDFANQAWFMVLVIDFVTQRDMSTFWRSSLTDFFNNQAKDVFPELEHDQKEETKKN